ncbi:hypothetical protein FKW77_003815 [Venturia effusa]|uniref:DUF1772 domain-containing protein n=1 Tax=Venturia effusa TaxID=50376 RepID=A0A517LR12_9PEZI|nr:hypothetical protein FKW77_003815 [Venturia effusa]
MSQSLLNHLNTLVTDTPVPAGIRIAQVIGITSAAYLSGYIANFSFVGVPSLARAPVNVKPLVWQDMYRIGASTAPYMAILSSLSFGYLASTGNSVAHAPKERKKIAHPKAVPRTPDLFRNHKSRTFYLYAMAAILVPAIVPYTVGIMKLTNDRLHQRAERYKLVNAWEVKEDGEMEELLKKWTTLNTTRSLLPLAATLFGLWAIMS